MSGRFGIITMLCLFAGTAPASAHALIGGVGGVFGGVLHALLVPEHALSLLALGMVLGQQQPPSRRAGILIFMAALTCGLVAAALASGAMLAADVLLTVTGILGLLIAAAWFPRIIALSAAALAGVALALDSTPDATSSEETVRMLIGSGLGAAVVVALLSEALFASRSKAQLMASRVLGSWIAAIAILVLSLRIVTQMTVGG
jgi:hypothetical protein